MDKRIRWNATTLIAIAGVVVIIVLLIAGISINRKINKQAAVRALEIVNYYSTINHRIVKSQFDYYDHEVRLLATLRSVVGSDDSHFAAALRKVSTGDSAIVGFWQESYTPVGSGGDALRGINIADRIPKAKARSIGTYLYRTSETGKKLFCIFSTDDKGRAEFGIALDLNVIHNKLINVLELRGAYTVVINESCETIYHPELSQIGLPAQELTAADILDMKGAKSSSKENTFSKYLELATFRSIYKDSIGSSVVYYAIYVPSLDYKDYIRKTQINVILLIVLPLVLLLLLVFLGMMAWKREFMLREQVEKKELRLKLQAEQHQSQLISSELENLKNGVNPHFLFNSLGSLKALIKRDTAKAVDFTQTLSNLYRYLLETEAKNIVSLERELTFAASYITIQNIRFGNSIVAEFLVNARTGYGVPPLAIQTLVENSIKHNTSSASSPLRIRIAEEEGYIVVSNTYNPRKEVVESTGKGISNLVKRYAYLTNQPCHFYVKEGEYYARIPILKV